MNFAWEVNRYKISWFSFFEVSMIDLCGEQSLVGRLAGTALSHTFFSLVSSLSAQNTHVDKRRQVSLILFHCENVFMRTRSGKLCSITPVRILTLFIAFINQEKLRVVRSHFKGRSHSLPRKSHVAGPLEGRVANESCLEQA